MSERRKKILIATPIHNDNLLLSYVQSVFLLTNNKDKPYDVTVFFRKGSLVNRCRNELLAYFLESDCDYIFFVDSDIVHFEEAFYKIVDSYLVLEKKIPKLMLGAVYPIKHYNFDYISQKGQIQDSGIWQEGLLNYNVNIKNLNIDNNSVLMEADQNNGFVHCQDIAGGFMMFSRKVLLDMISFYPESKYNAFNNDKHLPREHLYNLFHSFVEETTRFYLSEDYGFCYYFRKMGGLIYANIRIKLSHFGEEKFTGALYNTLQQKAQHQQAKQQSQEQMPNAYQPKTIISSFNDEYLEKNNLRNKTINYIKNDNCIGDCIKKGYYWEEWMLKYIEQNYIKNTNMIDLGGNIGTTTLLMSEVLSNNCNIFTFEPIYSDILLKNILVNNLTDKVVIYPYGVGNEIKTLKIKPINLLDNINFGAVSIPRHLDDKNDSFEINIVPLDYFNFENISLIKIDVEHMEIEVLEGSLKLIKRYKPTIIIETHQIDTFKQTNVFKELLKLGYQIDIIPEGCNDFIMKIK